MREAVPDTVDIFHEDTISSGTQELSPAFTAHSEVALDSGRGLSDPKMVKTLAEHSASAWDFLKVK